MEIGRDKRLLNGEGLQQYTELLAGKFNAITTSIADLVNGATVIVTLKDAEDAINGLDTRLDDVEDRLGDAEQAIGEQGDIIEGLTTTVDGLTTTTIPGIQDQITALTTSLTTTYKTLQEVKENTAPTGTYFIGIRQNTQGVITAITATFPTAATTTQGMVMMDSGATTSVVYDTAQVDGIISGIEGAIDGITTTIDGMQDDISGISTTVEGLEEVINGITTPLDETFKTLQAATTLAAPIGEYISGIEQDEQGVVAITATALPTVPTASSTTPGLVTVVGVTNPTGTAYEVYSKEKLDELLDDVVGGDLSGIDSRLSDLEGNVQGTGAKRLQTAVSSPSAGSTPAIEFIDTISQNANGDITVTKQAVRTAAANVSGIVTMATGASTSIVYDADQVDDAIAEAVASVFKAEVATADQDGYPDVQNPEENTIYLVPNGTSTEPNYYIEYIWMDSDPTGKWEVVGNTELAIETLSTAEVTNIFNGVFNS